MVYQLKILLITFGLLALRPLYSQQLDEQALGNFVGLGAGLNPLCIVVSEDRFACTTQASFYAASSANRIYAKADQSYIFLSSRQTDTNSENIRTGQRGPRNLNLSSFNLGFYTSLFEGAGMPISLGIGGGRYYGSNVVQHRSYSKASDGSGYEIAYSSEEYGLRGSVFHIHIESGPESTSTKNAHLKFLINIDAFHPDHKGEDAFGTGTVITMPTPQIYWGLNF